MTVLAFLKSWFAIGPSRDLNPDELMRRRVMLLAWPAMLQGLFLTSIQVVDTYVVSHLSEEALAAVGTASQLVYIMMILFIAVEAGVSVMVAHAIGARDSRRASAVIRQAVVLVLLISIPLAVTGFVFGDPLLGLFGMEPEVQRLALDYWEISALSMPILMVVFVQAGALMGAGDTRTPMLATILASGLNGFFAYALVFGKFGLPDMGVQGSALASTIGWSAEVIVLAYVLIRRKEPVSLSAGGRWTPSRGFVSTLSRIGLPTAGEEASWSFGFALLTGIVAVLGTSALAAHRIVGNAQMLSFMPGLGLTVAATALVGQSVGARDPASGRRAMTAGAQFAAAWMGFVGVIYFIFAEPIVRAFSSDPAVVDAGAGALRALAITQPLWGLMLAYTGAMRGTGKTVFPMVVNSVMVWAAVGLGALAVHFELGFPAIWWGFAVVAPIPVILLRWRLAREPLLMGDTPAGDDDVTPDDPPSLDDSIPLRMELREAQTVFE